MDATTMQILNRWQSLRSETGLKRAELLARMLYGIGLILFLVIVFGISYGLPTTAVAIVAAVMGWVVAERNALKARIIQWPTIAGYIDWDRVSNDLNANKPKVF